MNERMIAVLGNNETFAAMNAPPHNCAESTKINVQDQWALDLNLCTFSDNHGNKKGYIDCATIFTLSDVCMTKSRSEKHHCPRIPYLKKFTDDKVSRNMLKRPILISRFIRRFIRHYVINSDKNRL